MCEYYLHFDINLPYPEEELKNCIANRDKYALGKDKISQFTGKKQKKKKKKKRLRIRSSRNLQKKGGNKLQNKKKSKRESFQEFCSDEFKTKNIKKKELVLDQTGTIIMLKHVV